MNKDEAERWQEEHLDENIDTWNHGKTTIDGRRKARGLNSVDNLKDEIINLRMAYHDHDLNEFRGKIQELQDQRTFILQSPMNKKEFLARAKEIVHDRKREALNRLVLMPLATTRDGNLLPALETTRVFPEEQLWSLLYLAITDEDLEAVVGELPGMGLSTEERKAKVAEINAEITKLTDILNSKRAEAETALKKCQPK